MKLLQAGQSRELSILLIFDKYIGAHLFQIALEIMWLYLP